MRSEVLMLLTPAQLKAPTTISCLYGISMGGVCLECSLYGIGEVSAPSPPHTWSGSVSSLSLIICSDGWLGTRGVLCSQPLVGRSSRSHSPGSHPGSRAIPAARKLPTSAESKPRQPGKHPENLEYFSSFFVALFDNHPQLDFTGPLTPQSQPPVVS